MAKINDKFSKQQKTNQSPWRKLTAAEEQAIRRSTNNSRWTLSAIEQILKSAQEMPPMPDPSGQPDAAPAPEAPMPETTMGDGKPLADALEDLKSTLDQAKTKADEVSAKVTGGEAILDGQSLEPIMPDTGAAPAPMPAAPGGTPMPMPMAAAIKQAANPLDMTFSPEHMDVIKQYMLEHDLNRDTAVRELLQDGQIKPQPLSSGKRIEMSPEEASGKDADLVLTWLTNDPSMSLKSAISKIKSNGQMFSSSSEIQAELKSRLDAGLIPESIVSKLKFAPDVAQLDDTVSVTGPLSPTQADIYRIEKEFATAKPVPVRFDEASATAAEKEMQEAKVKKKYEQYGRPLADTNKEHERMLLRKMHTEIEEKAKARKRSLSPEMQKYEAEKDAFFDSILKYDGPAPISKQDITHVDALGKPVPAYDSRDPVQRTIARAQVMKDLIDDKGKPKDAKTYNITLDQFMQEDKNRRFIDLDRVVDDWRGRQQSAAATIGKMEERMSALEPGPDRDKLGGLLKEEYSRLANAEEKLLGIEKKYDEAIRRYGVVVKPKNAATQRAVKSAIDDWMEISFNYWAKTSKDISGLPPQNQADAEEATHRKLLQVKDNLLTANMWNEWAVREKGPFGGHHRSDRPPAKFPAGKGRQKIVPFKGPEITASDYSQAPEGKEIEIRREPDQAVRKAMLDKWKKEDPTLKIKMPAPDEIIRDDQTFYDTLPKTEYGSVDARALALDPKRAWQLREMESQVGHIMEGIKLAREGLHPMNESLSKKKEDESAGKPISVETAEEAGLDVGQVRQRMMRDREEKKKKKELAELDAENYKLMEELRARDRIEKLRGLSNLSGKGFSEGYLPGGKSTTVSRMPLREKLLEEQRKKQESESPLSQAKLPKKSVDEEAKEYYKDYYGDYGKKMAKIDRSGYTFDAISEAAEAHGRSLRHDEFTSFVAMLDDVSVPDTDEHDVEYARILNAAAYDKDLGVIVDRLLLDQVFKTARTAANMSQTDKLSLFKSAVEKDEALLDNLSRLAAFVKGGYIKKINDRKWAVYSKSGKKLGQHQTKAEADAQLAALEARKHEAQTLPKVTKKIKDAVEYDAHEDTAKDGKKMLARPGHLPMEIEEAAKEGQYMKLLIKWDAKSDAAEHMSASGLAQAVISFVKGLESKKEFKDIGFLGQINVGDLDVKAGSACAWFKASRDSDIIPKVNTK
jgi:hypothetical protein